MEQWSQIGTALEEKGVDNQISIKCWRKQLYRGILFPQLHIRFRLMKQSVTSVSKRVFHEIPGFREVKLNQK